MFHLTRRLLVADFSSLFICQHLIVTMLSRFLDMLELHDLKRNTVKMPTHVFGQDSCALDDPCHQKS